MLIDRTRSLLLAIDFQTKLAPAIHEGPAAIARARRLLEIARILEVPRLASEQYPQGLGPTVPELAELFAEQEIVAKLTFSAAREPAFLAAVEASGRRQLVVTGTEAHVCVLQTAMVLHQEGYEVFLVADAVGSRTPENRSLALQRMRAAGIAVVSAEMVAFEWLGRAGDEAFRTVLPLIK